MSTPDLALPASADIAIVGLGPTGVTLACLLARAGLSVVALDKADSIYPQPRAVGFDHDAMRIFQTLGAAEALAPHVTAFREGIYVGADNQVIRRIRHIEPPYPLTWPPHFSCDQPGVEAVLRDTLQRLPNAVQRTGVEVIDHADLDDRIRLTVRDHAGATSSLEARYVVACDGASSPIRRRLGLSLDDLQYDEPWIVVDMQVEPAVLDRLPPVNVQYCDPLRPSTYINCPGRHRRWEFMLLPGEPREGVLEPERLWALLARWLAPGEATIWRAAAYRFHALVARHWRSGRVLLAGDSAHQTPPFLGQGMCQGLRDAGNLAWKLIAVLRDGADPALLDSYEAERKPHVIETTRLAKAFGEIISERDPAIARQRDARMLAANGGEPQTLVRQGLIPDLTEGLLGGPPGQRAPLAGRVVPQPEVEDEAGRTVLLDDVTGPAWRLLLSGSGDRGRGDAADMATLVRRCAAARVALVIIDSPAPGRPLPAAAGAAPQPVAAAVPAPHRVRALHGLLGDWLAEAGCIGVLVRPDHYAYGGFADLAAAIALLDDLSSL